MALDERVRSTLQQTIACMVGDPWQNHDGGIGREPGKQSDLWSTSEALILGNAYQRMGDLLPNAVSGAALGRMKDYVLDSRSANGVWNATDQDSDVVGTNLVLMALWRWRDNPDVQQVVARAMGWLAHVQNPDGGWAVRPHTIEESRPSTAYPTITAYEAIGMWSLDHIGPIDRAAQALNDAKNWLFKVRKGTSLLPEIPDTPPTARHTSYQALANASVGQLDLNTREIVKWLEHQQHDGMWGIGRVGDIESTAVTVRALLLLDEPPRARHIRRAVEAILERWVDSEHDGQPYRGWAVRPDGGPASYTTFYALMALLDYFKAIHH